MTNLYKKAKATLGIAKKKRNESGQAIKDVTKKGGPRPLKDVMKKNKK